MNKILLVAIVAVAFLTQAQAAEHEDNIKQHCTQKWGTDYSMIEYCMDRQLQAAQVRVNLYHDEIREDPDRVMMMMACLEKWSWPQGDHDWEMVNYCYEQQSEAYQRLNQ